MKPYYPNYGQIKDLIPRRQVCTDRVPIHDAPALMVMESLYGKKHWLVIDGVRYTCFMSRVAALHYCEERQQLSYSKPAAISPRPMK